VARFFLDNNVSRHLIPILTADGHHILTSRDEGLAARNDVEQLLAATDRNAILVTHDREDFLLLHYAWLALCLRWHQTEAHPGIVVVPQVAEAAVHRYLTEFLQGTQVTQNACWRYGTAEGWVRY
jgi:hypothetical protein